MKQLRVLDESLRMGQQALWATRMKTKWMLPIAPVMDAAGFYQVAAMAPVSFETAAMYLYENPWERLRLLRQHMPHTKFDFLVRSRNVVGWVLKPNDVVELFLKTLGKIGLHSIKVFDGLNDFSNVAFHLKVGKELGFHVKALLSFAVSPIHTDDYYVAKARELATLGVDAIIIADPCGAMLPERARTLIGRVRAELPEIELHFSNSPEQRCFDALLSRGHPTRHRRLMGCEHAAGEWAFFSAARHHHAVGPGRRSLGRPGRAMSGRNGRLVLLGRLSGKSTVLRTRRV